MSGVDYRTGPQKLFSAIRGELLGPVKSPWPDGQGGTIEFFHKYPNADESAKIQGPHLRRSDRAWQQEFISRARSPDGELIYAEEELDMISTGFPPMDVQDICIEMRNQCDTVADKASLEALGNSSGKTQEPGTG